MAEFDIGNFAGGLNESVNASLIAPNEAQDLMNVNIRNGSLKASKAPLVLSSVLACPVNIETLMVYYNGTQRHFVVAGNGSLYLWNNTVWVLLGSGYGSNNWDFINYKLNGEDVMILVNGTDNNKILKGTVLRDMKDRRISYGTTGVVNGYYDANGVFRATEAEVTTLAPKAKFIELHFERIWLGDDSSVYFSKDFDPEDYTVPVTELEANQHGGEIVMESFDATKIIGMKVVFNDIVIFKEKSLFKIVGAYAEQYEKIQLFNFNGAIADRSIVITSKGAFFLNNDGIYQYDGVNCNLVSDKVKETIKSLNQPNLRFANAVNHDNKYILTANKPFSYNGVAHTYLTIEFDYENGTFTKHTYGMRAFLNVIHDLYGIAPSGNQIYEYGKGANLPFHFKTGEYTMNAHNTVKECEDFYIVGKGDSIDVTFETERKAKVKTFILKPNMSVIHKPLINFGRMFWINLAHTTNADIEITSLKAVMDIDMD